MGTSAAPSIKVAKSTAAHSQRFSARIAIRSPLTIPQAVKVLAKAYTRAMSAVLDMGCQAPAASCHSSARSRLLAATSPTTSTRVSRLNMSGVTNPDDCNPEVFVGGLTQDLSPSIPAFMAGMDGAMSWYGLYACGI